MEKVYDYLEEKGSPKDFAFEFKLTPVLGNNFSYIKGHRMLFYNPKTHPVLVIKSVKYTQKPPFFYEGNSLQVYYINRINEADYKNRKIFIIRRDKYAVRYYDDVSDQVLFQLLPKKVIGRFAVFELSLS
ncbi:MAG: hypothetical protein OXJ52_07830, partial [Oligoflexia bacterium]|nr:hypothetical protein [Oligoflexia bacterium]